MEKKISVIVPVYKVEKYLARCVDSIINQTYKNLEIILVDDGSPDGCGAMCDEYAKRDERIKVIHKENSGQSAARNAGLDLATGDYIGFVDSDDRLAPGAYENLLKVLDGKSDAIANFMYEREFSNGTRCPSIIPHTKDEIISVENYVSELMMHVGDVSACTKLFPRGVIGDLRFAVGILNEDLLFMLEIATKIKEIVFVGKVGYYYFVREGSTSWGYGKAIVDMQKNALWALGFVSEKYPALKSRAIRFALYQNMAYLLALPKDLAKRSNASFKSAIRFIRRNSIKAVFNKHLGAKQKVIISALVLFPRLIAKIYKNKNGK